MTPIAETLAALHELVVEGKVRYIGHSNLAGWQLAEADHVARELGFTPFISAQNQWSLLDRDAERELVPAAEHYRVGVLPYFPLAQGLLTGQGTARRADPGRHPARGPGPSGHRAPARPGGAAGTLADKHGRSVLDLAIGGLAARPVVGSVIAGASRPEQVRANVAAGSWTPTADELAADRRDHCGAGRRLTMNIANVDMAAAWDGDEGTDWARDWERYDLGVRAHHSG